MPCGHCRRGGHNRATCPELHPQMSAARRRGSYQPPVHEPASTTIVDPGTFEVENLVSIIESLASQLSEARAATNVPAQNPRGRPKPNLDKIQDILFTNKESIPEGVYLGLMDALVGK